MLPGLEQLVVQCAPQVAPVTMMAIVKVESGGNPFAINVNGSRRLARQPKSKTEALAWSEWLIANGYSIDMGLTQVNSANLRKLRTTPGAMFDPCANLAAGPESSPTSMPVRHAAWVPGRMRCEQRFLPTTPATIVPASPMAMFPGSPPLRMPTGLLPRHHH
jgi:hypothetical protein